ncbi:MAG: type II secretion system F family protein [bacterium]|nr:type II secretion system F family protein [bacterium]
MPTKADKSAGGGGVKRVRRATTKKRASRKPVAKPIEELVSEHEAATAGVDTTAPAKDPGFLSVTSVSREEVISFLRQLIMMLEAGTPLLRTLETLADRGERAGIRNLVRDIAVYVEAGNALWQAFERHPKYFDTVFISLVKASEASGTLVEVLKRQVVYWERRELLGKSVRRAMYYPVILVAACVGVMLLMAWVVIPQFEDIFKQIGGDLPYTTQLFIDSVKFFASLPFWIGLVIVVVGGVALFKFWVNSSPLNRLRIDRIKLRIPKLGPGILRKYAVVEFTRSLALLLRSGLSMMVTLDLVRAAIHNRAVAQVLQQMRDSVEQGEGIEEPLRQAPGVIPPVVTDMLVTGEESGQLDQISEHIADTYEEEVNIALAGLGDMIQPVLTILVGGIVLLAVLALFVPMLGMIQQISGGGM